MNRILLLTATLLIGIGIAFNVDIWAGREMQEQVDRNTVACFRRGSISRHRYGYFICARGNDVWRPVATAQ